MAEHKEETRLRNKLKKINQVDEVSYKKIAEITGVSMTTIWGFMNSETSILYSTALMIMDGIKAYEKKTGRQYVKLDLMSQARGMVSV